MTGDAARRGELLDDLDHWRKRALFAEEQWAYMGEQATAWQRRAERWKEAARVYRTGLQHAHISLFAISRAWTWRKFRRHWAEDR